MERLVGRRSLLKGFAVGVAGLLLPTGEIEAVQRFVPLDRTMLAPRREYAFTQMEYWDAGWWVVSPGHNIIPVRWDVRWNDGLVERYPALEAAQGKIALRLPFRPGKWAATSLVYTKRDEEDMVSTITLSSVSVEQGDDDD